jgi:hypothetical protein
LGVIVKFNLGATTPKIDALKTKAKHSIHNNRIKDFINLKGNISNIQASKSR